MTPSHSKTAKFDSVDGLLPPVIQPSVPYSVYLADYKSYLAMREHLLQDKWAAQARASKGDLRRPKVSTAPGRPAVKYTGANREGKPVGAISFGTIDVRETGDFVDLQTKKREVPTVKVPTGVVWTRDGRWLASTLLLQRLFPFTDYMMAAVDSDGEMIPGGDPREPKWDLKDLTGHQLAEGDAIAKELGAQYLRDLRLVGEKVAEGGPVRPKAEKPKAEASPPKSEEEQRAAALKKRETRRVARRRQRHARKARDVARRTTEVRNQAGLVRAEVALATATLKLEKVSGKGNKSSRKGGKPTAVAVGTAGPSGSGANPAPPSEGAVPAGKQPAKSSATTEAPARGPNRKQRRLGLQRKPDTNTPQ